MYDPSHSQQMLIQKEKETGAERKHGTQTPSQQSAAAVQDDQQQNRRNATLYARFKIQEKCPRYHEQGKSRFCNLQYRYCGLQKLRLSSLFHEECQNEIDDNPQYNDTGDHIPVLTEEIARYMICAKPIPIITIKINEYKIVSTFLFNTTVYPLFISVYI